MTNPIEPLPLKGLLFDKDGTLLDFQATWGKWAANLVIWLTETCPDRAEALAARLQIDRVGETIEPGSIMIAGTPDEIAREAAIVLTETAEAELSAQILNLSDRVTPVALCELAPLLRSLMQGGIHLGVATNDFEPVARAQLDQLGIIEQFGFVAGFDSGFGGKPGPGMCDAFLAAHGLAPHEAAMVGDSLHDMAAGRAAGMVCIAVETGTATRAELATLADIVLPDITCLPDWLGLAEVSA